MSELPVRAARWSARHPWRAVLLWLVFVVSCLAAGTAAGTDSATTEDYRVGEAGRAEAMAAEGGLQRRPEERVLISPRTAGGAASSDPAYGVAGRAAAARIRDGMRRLPEVAAVAEPVVSADGRAIMVAVTLRGPELGAQKLVGPLLAETAAVQALHPDLRIEQSGSPSISRGLNAQRGADLARSEAIALPVTLVVLLVVFGSVVAAAIPLLLAVTSIAAALGLAMLASHVFPDAGVGANVIILIGMAVGVDYSLFYLKRARAVADRDARAAVELAAATAGRAVAGSGLAVAICAATLYLAGDVIFSSLATATIVVTLVAVASSLTVLPALLVLAEQRRQRATARGHRRRTAERGRAGWGGTRGVRLWDAVMRPSSRRPVTTLTVSVLALLALAAPAAGLRLTEISLETYSRDIPAMQVRDRLLTAFPQLRVTHQVVVRADAPSAGQVRAALTAVSRNPPFTGASALRTSDDGRTTTLALPVTHRNDSAEARAGLDALRGTLLPAALGTVPGARWAVSGDVARFTDYPDHQRDRLPLVLAALLLATFVMTVAVFRSVVLGLLGVALNVLSAGAAVGLLVLVFQGPWAETGSIGSRVPLFLVVILFGLSMDYQFFVVSSVREAVAAGLPMARAVPDGLAASAGVVTSAAVVMTTVFVSFLFVDLIELRQMGFVLAAGVLLDAFVVRILVLPSILRLLGDRTWWPARVGSTS